ncbi:GntR family transcriptional regulator [Listeria booriae]|uniref:GntR family transcriptional regulator n=1 Tax=Listeria booriae TaxID=1552123 RepID=A0A7X0YT23_9LIST|nr:GntR family transcriptional regulator [Listeria booriae]MBC1552227.1 GntR family transcriptional regulator [Listeria booriae]MBC1565358.1 GntR family transcriptional regulator [Listeria booriae]MBC1800422.1 GntR family transcriptional regulator [Listeria booriae]MBC1906210.1 GntR family transcriptional regulator [Listeria booriae]MBC2037310.1 GntR family transcriptional regulator [Listeria booriae]
MEWTIIMNNKRPRLEEVAYAHVLKSIKENRLKMGDFVSQQDLAQELNMSRTPIRAAITKLSGEGYIRMLPYHGAFVAFYKEQSVEGRVRE